LERTYIIYYRSQRLPAVSYIQHSLQGSDYEKNDVRCVKISQRLP